MRMEVSDQKNTGIFAEKIASLHQEIQNRRPLVQCITNAVTVNDCANFCWQPVRPRPWHIIRRRLLRFPRGVMHWSAISGRLRIMKR